MIFEFLRAKTFEPFNSREIAAVICGGCLLVWAIRRTETRAALASLVKAALHWKLVILYSIPVCWTGLSVWLLATVGFWKLSLLKDTIFWMLFSGLALVGRSVGMRNSTTFFRQMIKDTLVITIVFEFLMNLYTFDLWAELLLVPFGICLAIAELAINSRPKTQVLKAALGCFQFLVGFMLIGFVAWSLYHQSQQAFSVETASQFTLPVLLSLLSIPMLYFTALFAGYEQLMVHLRIGGPRTFAVKFYGGLKLIDLFRFNLNQVLAARSRFASLLHNAHTHDEMDIGFTKYRHDLKRREGGSEAMKKRSKERIAIRSSSLCMPCVPLFQKPWEAAEAVLKLGLKDTLENEPAWRCQDDEWYSLAQLDIEYEVTPNFKMSGATITCTHTSHDEAYIETVSWSANVFDPELAQSTATRFKMLCYQYLTLLGCSEPHVLMVDVPQASHHIETKEAVYGVTFKETKIGYSWQLRITTKFKPAL
jgi:hypothetical protein